jgi:hypothetical protein
MKKLLFLIIFTLVIAFPQSSFSQNATTSGSIKHVNYSLPYPGILPDSPLYFLKAIRDNLISAFVSDPFKKVEYNLLMADKRLASAKYLIDYKKYDLAITTLSKSGNYFDKAIQQATVLKKQGKDVDGLLDKLITASQKHQEVIFQMTQTTKGETRYNLELLQIRAKTFQETVEVVKAN